tara:strand:- start:2199 stop:2456 length:258 start_codon:yes stop_codon:yes gene_type:complete
MTHLSLKKHRHNHFPQVLGFVGLLLVTIVTVVIGNSVYQYASVLHAEEALQAEEGYAIFEEGKGKTLQQPCRKDTVLSALLTLIK